MPLTSDLRLLISDSCAPFPIAETSDSSL